jgi:hypothetical protein
MMADQKKETISLEKFKKLCTDLFKQRVKADEMQALADAEKAILDDFKSKILAFFEDNEMEKFYVEGHGLLHTVDRFTVPTPKSVEAKKGVRKVPSGEGHFLGGHGRQQRDTELLLQGSDGSRHRARRF